MGYDAAITRELLGDVGPLRFNPVVIKVCDACGRRDRRRYKGRLRPTAPYHCRSCVVNRPEVIDKLSAATARQWESEEFRGRVQESSRSIWEDPERRARMSKFRDSPGFKDRMAEINRTKAYDAGKIAANMRRLWSGPAYRQHMIKQLAAISQAAWADESYRDRIVAATRHSWTLPEYRAKMMQVLLDARQQMPRVSRIQETLYGILADLGVPYYREYPDRPADRECLLGPYSFDCVVPRPGLTTLLIECQGDYWHAGPGAVRADRAKASYVSNNLGSQYELKYIWEHEFLRPERIADLIKYWLGISRVDTIDFDFKSVVVGPADARSYRPLLAKYHYLPNAGRGGIAYGARLGEELVAVCVFSPLPRQNIAQTLGVEDDAVRELSRLCIHPAYQKKNFASWLVARCIRLLPAQYRTIVSYCDTTFNHDGSVYLAANFTRDGTVPADYWYTTTDGWAVHKKTLYNHAVRMGRSEADYAASLGYKRVHGCEKLRFVYRR